MSTMFQRGSFFARALIGVLALSSIFATASPAFAVGGQTGVLSGRLVDASNAGIAGAEVTISAPAGRFTAHTDGKGAFSILGANADTYTLTVKKDGFVGLSQTDIGVIGDQTTDLGTITLQKS